MEGNTTNGRGNEMNDTTTTITEYDHINGGLAELHDEYHGVTFEVATPAGMKLAVTARATLRDLRTSLERIRKTIKAPALAKCKTIDTEAKRITAVIVALETPFDEQIKAQQAIKRAEKEAEERATQERIAAIERERLEKEQAELDAQREAQEAELAAERAEVEAERARIAEDELAERNERDRIEAMRQAKERAELERREAELAKAEAKRREESAATEAAEVKAATLLDAAREVVALFPDWGVTEQLAARKLAAAVGRAKPAKRRAKASAGKAVAT